MNIIMTEKVRHCEVCRNRSFSREGIVCSLTNDKPQFRESCKEFRPKDGFAKHLIDVNIDYEQLKKLRFDVFAFGIIFISIGLFLIVGILVAYSHLLDRGYIAGGKVVVIVVGIGLLVVAMGLSPIISYRRRRVVVNSRKELLDAILMKYQISYDFNLKFLRTYMDKWKVRYTLTLRQLWSTSENYEKQTFIKKKLI